MLAAMLATIAQLVVVERKLFLLHKFDKIIFDRLVAQVLTNLTQLYQAEFHEQQFFLVDPQGLK